jgi:hypothetical protein
MKNYLFIITVITLIPFTAQAQNYAVALKPGTSGIGIEAIRSFGQLYNVRFGYSYFNYDYRYEDSDDYIMDSTVFISSVSAIFDWFPFERVFHISAGIFVNMNDVDAVLSPKESHDVGGRIYTPEMLGSLTANIDFNKAAPYFGIGFGNGYGKKSGFTFDVGALYHGAPKVSLKTDGLLEPSAKQAPIVEENISWFQFYPVISIGYIYKL